MVTKNQHKTTTEQKKNCHHRFEYILLLLAKIATIGFFFPLFIALTFENYERFFL